MYIEHNGHKVVLSIAVEHKGKGFQSTIYVGYASDMTTLINKIDEAKTKYATLIQSGSQVVVDIQDYVSPQEAEDIFFNHGA